MVLIFLDWTKIDNDKIFQQLVNDLFALELGKPGYKPSSPYIGADGGWDGRFNESYLGLSGISCVQAKWTKHTLDQAYSSLREDIKEELIKTQSNKVDNLFITTNAELRIGTEDHIGKLEQLKSSEVSNLLIYHREKLSSLIERYPWLKHRYFGIPQRPLFVPYSDYRMECEPDLLTEVGLLERIKENECVKNFVNNNRKKILFIYAPQGQGKSHFLIEVAKNIQEVTDGSWQSWFCRPSLRTVEDAFQDEIHSDRNYVLFLDNADLYEEVTKKLLSVLKTIPANKLKLIISCRTPNKESVLSWIHGLRIVEFEALELNPLPEQVLISLLFKASKYNKFENPERIIRALGHNPFFVISYGRLFTGEKEPGEIRSTIRNSLESSVEIITSSGFTITESHDLLRELAAIVPFRLQPGGIIQCLAQVCNKTEETIIKAIEKLITAGALRYVGSSVRFSSDLNGNVYLAVVIDESNGEQITEDLFKRWLPLIPDTFASNISSVAYQSETSTIREATGKIVRNLVMSGKMGAFTKKSTLAWIKHLAIISPDQVTNLLFTYLDSQTDPEEISRDDYGFVIFNLLHAPGFQKYVLELILIMKMRNINGTFSNFEPSNLVRSAVSPIIMPNIDTAIHSLQILDNWARDTNCDENRAELIIAGIKEALSAG